jgi:hypothetical protein
MIKAKNLLSICLSLSLGLGPWLLEGCKNKGKRQGPAQPGQAQQAPATTAAVPSADELYQLVAPIALRTILSHRSSPAPPFPIR